MESSYKRELARACASSQAQVAASRRSCLETSEQVLGSRKAVERSLELLADNPPSRPS